MILLRHGQSEFNLLFGASKRDPGIPDPKLTPLGHAQAADAAEALADEGLTRIICSPYTRAIQTAQAVAERLRLPILIQPIVRERYAFSCDVGSPATALRLAFPQLDLAHIEEVWWPAVEEPDHGVEARAALFRGEMAALPDWSSTLVVCHWGFILAMTGQRLLNGEWVRCDPRDPPPRDLQWRHYQLPPKPAA